MPVSQHEQDLIDAGLSTPPAQQPATPVQTETPTESTETPAEVNTEEPTETPTTEQQSLVDTFEVEDALGNIRAVSIDTKNKDKLKEVVTQAARARALQDEMAALKDEITSLRDKTKTETSEATKLRELMNQDPKAILDHVLKDKGGFQAFYDNLYNDIKRGINATPEELAEMERNKALKAANDAKEAAIQRLEQAERRLQEREEKAAEMEMHSWVESAKTTYTFKDIFKDDDKRADFYGETLWLRTREQLGTLQDQGIKITQNIINKHMRDNYIQMKKDFTGLGNAQASTAIKKQIETASNAAVSPNGTSTNPDASQISEVKKLIDSGSISKILSNPKLLSVLNKYKDSGIFG